MSGPSTQMSVPKCLFNVTSQDLLTRVDDFQQRSERLLSDESPSPLELQELLDVSLGLDVELPQLPLLRERLEQARWLEAVQQASSRPESLCLDTMRRLIDQGVGLAPHSSVERAMARLQELLTVSEQWEERALSLMEARWGNRSCISITFQNIVSILSLFVSLVVVWWGKKTDELLVWSIYQVLSQILQLLVSSIICVLTIFQVITLLIQK